MGADKDARSGDCFGGRIMIGAQRPLHEQSSWSLPARRFASLALLPLGAAAIIGAQRPLAGQSCDPSLLTSGGCPGLPARRFASLALYLLQAAGIQYPGPDLLLGLRLRMRLLYDPIAGSFVFRGAGRCPASGPSLFAFRPVSRRGAAPSAARLPRPRRTRA